MEKIVKDYGAYIKERRLSKGLSQEEVASRLGISQQTYSRYELGTREPGLDFIKAVAEVLKFKPGEFFDNYRG